MTPPTFVPSLTGVTGHPAARPVGWVSGRGGEISYRRVTLPASVVFTWWRKTCVEPSSTVSPPYKIKTTQVFKMHCIFWWSLDSFPFFVVRPRCFSFCLFWSQTNMYYILNKFDSCWCSDYKFSACCLDKPAQIPWNSTAHRYGLSKWMNCYHNLTAAQIRNHKLQQHRTHCTLLEQLPTIFSLKSNLIDIEILFMKMKLREVSK